MNAFCDGAIIAHSSVGASSVAKKMSRSSSSWELPADPPPVPARKQTGKRDWLEQLANRLDAGVLAGKAERAVNETASSKAGAPSPPATTSWRTVDGVRAIGFNPGRHLWYIMGRPIVVP